MLHKHSSFRKIAAIFLSATTLMWSLGASLTALLLLASPMPALAATPTIQFIELDTADTNNQTLRVKFSEAVDATTAETEEKYTLHHGGSTETPDTATRQADTTVVVLVFTTALGASNPIVIGDTGDSLDINGVDDAAEGANLAIINGLHFFGGMDTSGGFFGPAIIVNEVVSNPQRDWNDTTPAEGDVAKFDAIYGEGTIDANDEYIELRINQAELNLLKNATPKYYLKIFNTSFGTEIGGIASNLEQYHADDNAAGIFDTVRYVGTGTAGDTDAGDFLVLGGLRGADLADNVQVAIFRGSNEFMNSVSFGTFNDMMTDDNAIVSGGTTGTEASGRDNYGTDMGWNKGDFAQQAGSPGTENTYDPALKLFGVFQMDATHVGLDFNEPPKQSTIIMGNFTVTKVSDSSTITVSSAFVEEMGGGRFVKLTLASTPVSNAEYRVAVGAGVTDQTDHAIAEADRVRSFMGFAADSTPPAIAGINQPDSKRIEVFFTEQSGIDVSAATVTVAETATPGNTINVSSKWASFDMVTLELASAPTAAMAYTVTFTGLKDFANPQNTLTTNNTTTFTGKNFSILLNDGMAPYVAKTVPMDFEAGIPTNIKKITVGFSEKMDPATVIAANVKLFNYTMASGAQGAEVTSGVTVAYNSDLQTATILLTDALTASSSYQIFVDGETANTANAVKDLSGSAMGYNYTSIFTTGTNTDTTAANITNTGVDVYWNNDAGKYKDVPVGIGRISVAFDGAMDSSTIVDSDASNAGSPIRISTTIGGTATYAYGSVEYDNYAKVADFKLSSVLSPNVEYTLAVETTVTDFAGNAIPAKFTRLFTTAGTDAVAPTILSAESGGAGIFIKFSEPVKAAQASNLSNWALYSDTNANPITAVGLGSAMSEYMSFDNAVEIRGLALTAGNYFKIVAAGTIEDLAGNDVILNSYKTAQVMQATEWKEQLMVWDHYPRMQQNSVPTNTTLSARFSDSLNSTTVTTTTVKLYTVSSSGVAAEVTGEGLAVSYKSDINTVKFTPPTAGLTANTLYRWKIGTDDPSTSIKDTAGNSLPFPFVVEFFTGSGADVAAPTVSSVSPLNAATGVATALSKYEINFSEAMDSSTLNSGTILMAKTADDIADGPYVSGTIDYDPYAFKLFFKPAAAFAVDTEYTVRITISVKDAAGVVVAGNIDKTFTTTATADTTGPKIEFVNADPYGLFVKFDEPIKEDLATAARNYTLITCASSGDLDTDGIAKSLTDKTIKYQFWDNSIFIESVGLSAGYKFRVAASNLKDLSENAMQTGTDASSATNFRKIESADLAYNQWEGTVFDPTYRDESPFVTYSFPSMGSNSAPLNLSRIEIGFSEGVQTSTLTSTTFKVYPLTSLGVEGTALTATSITYDDASKTAYFNLDPTNQIEGTNDKVAAGTQYRIKLTTGVQDSGGNAMKSFNPWDANCTTAYENMFTVASANDTVAPKVMGTSVEMYRNCATNTACPVENVPTGIGAIDIKFSEAMDVNTIKDLNAGDASSNIYLENAAHTKVAGSVEYNSFDQKATFVASAALTNNVAYTLIVGTGVKDIAANAIGAQYSLSFTTSSSADTSKPFVGHAEAEAFEVKIFFNERIVKTQVEDINNFVLESPIGTSVSLRGKTPVYDPMGNMVKIPDLALTGDKNFRVTVTGVTDIAGNAISVTADHHSNDDHVAAGTDVDPNSPRDIGHEGTPNVDNTQFNQFEGYVMAHFGGFFGETVKSDYTHEQKMFDNFSGKANVFPQMGMAGQTSVYFINFPVRTAIPLGGSIVVRFPEGYDVTNAQAMAAFNPSSPSPDQSPMNGDINGPNTGTITIASVTPNVIARTITVVTAGAASQANDFISFDIKGIVNPSTPKDFGSQGYTANITTKTAAGLTLEGPTDSQPIFITSKGTGTISGTITAAGADNNASFTVRLQTPNGMIQETLLINDDKVNGTSGATSAEAAGEAKYSFANLPAGDYNLFVDPVITLAKSSVNTDYMAPPFHEMIRLAIDETKSYPITLTDSSAATYTDNWGNELTMRTIAVSITGGPASKKVVVRAGGPMNFFEKEVTLDGSGAGTATIKAPNGMYWINVDPYMPMMSTTMGPMPAPDFCPPPGSSVNANGVTDGNETAEDAITVALANYTANKYIEVTVQDTNDVAINNVDVGAHNPNKGFGVPPTRTGQNGKATIKVPAGTYQIDAFVPGMPPLPSKTVTVTSSNDSAHPATITIEVSFDSDNMIEITGQVVNGTSTVPYAPVWATEINSAGTLYLPGFIPGGTDSNGKFSFFVPSGSNWELRSNIPGMGETSAIKLYNITSSPSSQTLSARTDLVAITGTIKLNTTAVQHAHVFAEGIDATQYFNGTDTGTNGAYTLYVQAGTYKIKTFSPEYGEKIISSSSTVVANTPLVIGDSDLSAGVALVTVTINFKNAAGSALTVEKAFVDIFNITTGEGNKKDFSGVSSGTLKVPAGTYSVNGFIKGVGPIASQTLNTASIQIVNIQAASNTVALSGTVVDGLAANVEGAFVEVFCPTTGFKEATRTASDGAYSITVPAGQTYDIIANKTSYQPALPIHATVAAINSTGNNITLTAADENKKITGSVYLGTAIAANLANNTTKKAFVWADTVNGDWVGAPVEADGSYTLYVKAGTWKVRAAGDGYETTGTDVKTITIANTASTGQNFALTAISGYITQQAAGTSFTPTSSGRAASPDNKARIIAPANSIKADADSGDVTLQVKPTTRAPKKTETIAAAGDGSVSVTATITPMVDKAQEVTAEDTSGPIATLSGSINIEFDYSDYDAEVVAAIEADPSIMTCQYLNEANQWETTEAVSNDTNNHILTCTTSHLSVYAPSIKSNILAPDAPTGVVAVAGANQVTVNWTKNSESDMHHYIVWESEVAEGEIATVLQSACSGSTCTYTHTGRTNGTTYGYQIMAVDSDGYTSAGSSIKTAVPAASNPPSSPSGGSVAVPIPATPSTATGSVTATQALGGETTYTSTTGSKAKMVMPNYAVSSGTTVLIAEKTASSITASQPVPSGKGIAGPVYEFKAAQGTTNITTFSKQLALTFTYTDAQAAGLQESTLKIYYWNGTQWIALASTISAATNIITASVDHFTYFTIMGSLNIVQEPETPIVQTPEDTTVPQAPSQTIIPSAGSYSNGSLLNLKGNPTVWLIENSMKHGVPSEKIFLSRFRWQDIVTILSATELDKYQTGENLKYSDGTLLSDGKTTYVISEGKKKGFTSAKAFTGLGYSWKNVIKLSALELAQYQFGDAISTSSSHLNGALIKINNTVFKIENGKLRGIPSLAIFEANGYKFSNVASATAADKALPFGQNLTYPDGTLLVSKTTVYLITDGKKRGFTSASAFTSRGYKWTNLRKATDAEIAAIVDGELMN